MLREAGVVIASWMSVKVKVEVEVVKSVSRRRKQGEASVVQHPSLHSIGTV